MHLEETMLHSQTNLSIRNKPKENEAFVTIMAVASW